MDTSWRACLETKKTVACFLSVNTRRRRAHQTKLKWQQDLEKPSTANKTRAARRAQPRIPLNTNNDEYCRSILLATFSVPDRYALSCTSTALMGGWLKALQQILFKSIQPPQKKTRRHSQTSPHAPCARQGAPTPQTPELPAF